MSDCRKCAEFDWCVENEDCGLFKPKPQTNADRIRAMTNEEMAEWLDNIDTAYEPETVVFRHGWLDWLKSPVEVDGEKQHTP